MFVTFEGPEGAGKSTAIRSVANRLEALSRTVVVTREPGSGEVGAAIRQILLHGGSLDPKCELFLFLADRAQHVASIVRPALGAGHIVLCDRFIDSTIVYQGVGRGLDPSVARAYCNFATDGLMPDLTLLLDLPPEVGQGRVVDRDRIDNEPIEFHQKIRDGFLDLARNEPTRWRIVDASAPIEDAAESCFRHIQSAVIPS